MKIILAVACLPCLFYMAYLYKYDRVEKEPIPLLVWLLVGGAISAILTLIISQLAVAIENSLFYYESIFYYIYTNFITTALVEEGCKFILLYLLTWKSKNFNCTYDGLIYAVFISLGFAMLENILYTISYGIGTGMMRAFTSIPGHVAFGVFMGVYYARAKFISRFSSRKNVNRELFKGLLLAVLAHGFYDFTCSFNYFIVTIIYFLFLAFLYFYIFKMVKKCSKEDQQFILEKKNPEYIDINTGEYVEEDTSPVVE